MDADCGGGSRGSNILLLAYQLQLAQYLLNNTQEEESVPEEPGQLALALDAFTLAANADDWATNKK